MTTGKQNYIITLEIKRFAGMVSLTVRCGLFMYTGKVYPSLSIMCHYYGTSIHG